MKAMLIQEFGGIEGLAIGELPKPEIGPEDVLIEVHATSLNPVDTKVRMGAGMYGSLSLPMVGGFDVSGVVVACGENVNGLAVGDEVYGSPSLARYGAHAEYVAVDARTLARKPSNLSHEEAAALPLVFLTAFESLIERTNIQEGEHVLIQAGAGGVGHIGIQIAKAHGCVVITTASNSPHSNASSTVLNRFSTSN